MTLKSSVAPPSRRPTPAAYNRGMKKPSMREHLLQVRQDAIISVVNQLLAEKGYDAMTVDEVAAQAGLSKAVLYKHFRSKEELAVAAMVVVLERAMAFAESPAVVTLAAPIDRLKAVVRWTLQAQLEGAMPSLPAQNSALRSYLASDRTFTRRLMGLSDILGDWIEAGLADGTLDAELPGEVILFTLYARACDQVLQVLKAARQHSDEAICDFILRSCFAGLAPPSQRLAPPKRRAATTNKNLMVSKVN